MSLGFSQFLIQPFFYADLVSNHFLISFEVFKSAYTISELLYWLSWYLDMTGIWKPGINPGVFLHNSSMQPLQYVQWLFYCMGNISLP